MPKVNGKHIRECQRLLAEMQHYIALSGSLKKVFLSIKGIYYQAEIKGQTITWITPYQFSQDLPHDVDFRVMSTFLEVYETLVGFTNYKLYSELSLVYPPRLDSKLMDDGAELGAYVVETQVASQPRQKISKKGTKEFQERVKALEGKFEELKGQDAEDEEEEESDEEVEEEELDTPKPIVAPTTVEEQVVHMDRNVSGNRLFAECYVWISREVPRYSVEFIIKSFGGKCGWDATIGAGSPFEMTDKRITHHITDRPQLSADSMIQGREYLQPQWIYDSVNQGKLVKTNNYHPGESLPPHLSPFAVAGEDDYQPDEDVKDDEIIEEEVF
jgi:pescadillo protein